MACNTAHASNASNIGVIKQLGNGYRWESWRPKGKQVNEQTGNSSNHYYKHEGTQLIVKLFMKSRETTKKGGQAMQGHLFKTGHSFFADQFHASLLGH